MIADTYADGRYLRRWSLIAGWAVCALDALDTQAASPEAVEAVTGENARIHALVAQAQAYEAAAILSAPPRPPALVDGVNPEGELVSIANPARAEWDAAKALVTGALASTLTLVARRANADLEPDENRLPSLMVAVMDPAGLVRLVQAVDADWQPQAPLVAVECPPETQIGATYAGGVFTAPPAVVPVPQQLDLGQLIFALRNQQWITHAEALAAVKTGEMPTAMTATLAGAVQAGAMTAQQADDAAIIWAAMYRPVRTSSLWAIFVAAGTATSAQVDALFIEGATL